MAAASLRVWCFGAFRLSRQEEPVDCMTVRPRTRAALRLLAAHAGRPVHRETLTAALWPEMAAGHATHNLHVTLSNLRRLLAPVGPRLLVRNGDAYELVLPAGAYSDVATFRAALDLAHEARLAGDRPAATAALRTALHAYGGELLPEDGPAEWVVAERETLRRRAADAAIALARTCADPAEAVWAADRCVQIDRYCDAGWRLLIAGHARLGDRAAGEHTRRRYGDLLIELGVG